MIKEQYTIGIPDDSKSTFSHVFGEKNSVRNIAHHIVLCAVYCILISDQIWKRLQFLVSWCGFAKVPFFVFPLCKSTRDGFWLLLVFCVISSVFYDLNSFCWLMHAFGIVFDCIYHWSWWFLQRRDLCLILLWRKQQIHFLFHSYQKLYFTDTL